MADSTTNAPLSPAKIRDMQTRSRMTLAAMRLMSGKAGGIQPRKLDSRDGSTFDALIGATIAYWQTLRGEG